MGDFTRMMTPYTLPQAAWAKYLMITEQNSPEQRKNNYEELDITHPNVYNIQGPTRYPKLSVNRSPPNPLTVEYSSSLIINCLCSL